MTPRALRNAVRDYALGLPEAYEDHPWGEDVAKVRKKVFVFLGTDESVEPGIGLKLVASHDLGLAQPGVTPMGYGLGDSGWVSIRLSRETPFEMLREWVDESYRAIAPKAVLALADVFDRIESTPASVSAVRPRREERTAREKG